MKKLEKWLEDNLVLVFLLSMSLGILIIATCCVIFTFFYD